MILPVHHVQGWVELVCSDCDATRYRDEPVNVFVLQNVTFPSPVDYVSLDMTGLGPLQLRLHVWLRQTLVRGQVASRPEIKNVLLFYHWKFVTKSRYFVQTE